MLPISLTESSFDIKAIPLAYTDNRGDGDTGVAIKRGDEKSKIRWKKVK